MSFNGLNYWNPEPEAMLKEFLHTEYFYFKELLISGQTALYENKILKIQRWKLLQIYSRNRNFIY